MSQAQLDALLALFRKYPFDPAVGEGPRRRLMDRMGEVFAPPPGVTVEARALGGVPAERLTASADGPALLYLHGGGYVTGSVQSHRHLGGLLAAEMQGVVDVLDYRLAPEAPFPAALDDAVAAWQALATERGGRPAGIAGDSAGGGLAFATALRCRAAGLPMPGCIVGLSPWVNLGTESESYDKLGPLDPTLSREAAAWYADRYLAGADRRDPMASPLFAELAGLPPVLIQVGDREVFFGDAASMHQSLLAAGVEVRLSVWDRMFHAWHLSWPQLDEGRAALAEAAAFIRDRLTA